LYSVFLSVAYTIDFTVWFILLLLLLLLQDLKSQWQEFSSSLHGAEDVVRAAQETMATVAVPADTQADLMEQLEVVRVSVNAGLSFKNKKKCFVWPWNSSLRLS
jgi:hypothetical protein